jgi:hypothetical protein
MRLGVSHRRSGRSGDNFFSLQTAESRTFGRPVPSLVTVPTESSWLLTGCSLNIKYREIILSDSVTSHFPSALVTYSWHTGSSPRCMSQSFSVFRESNVVAMNTCLITRKLTPFSGIVINNSQSYALFTSVFGCIIVSMKLLSPSSQNLNPWDFYLGRMWKDKLR